MNVPHSLWSIILSGGQGERMCPLVYRCFEQGRPKQYCRFCGPKSMLEQTIERALDLVEPDRLITVIGSGHRGFLGSRVPGRVLEQPEMRGTAVGVFWPLVRVLNADPDATVLVLPSDHYFYPRAALLSQLEAACQLAKEHSQKAILVGAIPDAPETDYGWIEPVARSASHDHAVRYFEVSSFHEKPSQTLATRWFEDGYLWNTMITIGRAETLWKMGREVLPDVVRTLEEVGFGKGPRAGILSCEDPWRRVYEKLPNRDFSRDFLAQVAPRSLVMPLDGVFWSDWGRPERLYQSLNRMREAYPEWIDSPDCARLEQVWNRWAS